MPLPTPIWFVWQAGSFVIYSKPTALKVCNLQRHPKAALNFNSDFEGEDVALFYGMAPLDPHAPYSCDYLAKCHDGILALGLTPESYQRCFSLTIHLTLSRVREGGGELPKP
jgi:PPOX class probable F420-dependent enzyme